MFLRNRNLRFLIGSALKRIFPRIAKNKAIYRYLSFTRVTNISILDKQLKLYCHNEEISNSVFYTGIFGDYEGQTLKMWHQTSKFLKQGIVLDIGAYTGIFSLTALSANPKLCIHAFEPNPFTFNFLKKNIDLNNLNNVVIYNFGLSSKSGTEKFYNFGDSASSGMTLINHQHVNPNLSHSEFKVRDISDFRKALNEKISLIKLDIERAELQLLKHAEDIIKNDRPIIFCEILDIDMYEDFQTFFEKLEYEYVQISDSQNKFFYKSDISNSNMIGRNWILFPGELKQDLISAFTT